MRINKSIEVNNIKGITQVDSYSNISTDMCCWLNGSDGYIEIAMNQKSVGKKLNAEIGSFARFIE
jgi:S-adenosylmethionine hydrolase